MDSIRNKYLFILKTISSYCPDDALPLSLSLRRIAKIYLLGQSAAGLSVMHPVPYKDRFQKKMSQLIEHSIFIREVTGSWQGKR